MIPVSWDIRRAFVQRPRRRRTLKRDEHGVCFILDEHMRRLACVLARDKNRECEPDQHSRTRYDKRICRQPDHGAD
jgi:hypothetical protein